MSSSFNSSKKNIIVTLVAVIAVVVLASFSFILMQNKKDININKILESKDYSYLPKEAKNYIQKVYEKTGNVLLTEKNKEENKPYLNPDYVGYLSLPEKEKEKVELIPDTYILDYSISQTYDAPKLPSTFDLRNQNGYNFVSSIKNQGATNICWAFASIENVETLYMKNNNQAYSDLVPKFSVRQMDYITSTGYDSSSSTNYLALDGNWSSGMCNYSNCSWTPWKNSDNGSHELNKGGNFFTSSIAMANGITLTDESVMPWHEEKNPVLVNDIYGYNKSLYEADSTIQMPIINEDNASEELINSYVKDIKNYMIQYGGPFVGTYSPKSTCGFENVDGSKALKTDDCVSNTTNKDLGHAMQIIGWDDNYEYSYCESGTNHYSVSSNNTCSKGKLTTGKGAWILRNSWGTETAESQEYSYVYLTYDSTRLSIGFTTSISDMKNRTWDNNYHSNPWIERKISNGMASVNSQTKEFNTHNKYSEKIQKIKFLTSSKNGTYNISILTENKNYNNIGTITTTETGIYTIDLSEKNIILDKKAFSVKIESEEAQFINDSISVFTSNTSHEPSLETNYVSGIKTYEEPGGNPTEENVAFISSYGDTTIKLEHHLKNITDYKKITYKAILDDVDYSRYFFIDYSNISSNMTYIDGFVTTTLGISEERYLDADVCGNVYTFQILYDNVVIESFPLKRICDDMNTNTREYTTSKIKFHKNDGSGYFSTIIKNDTTNFKIMKSDGTGDTDIGDESEFFQYDRYIKSWNTKPDGTGVSYTDNEYFVYKDMDFYAQWSDPQKEKHQYTIEFRCNRYVCHESQNLRRNSKVTFNEEFVIPTNSFTNLTEGQEFIYWAFDADDEEVYYEEEKFVNLTRYGFGSPYNNEEKEYLEAVWSDSYNSVSFDANGGLGSMKDIKIIKDKTSRLKYNLFTRDGYIFKGWNTKADGTGTSYTDGQKVTLTEDITLYAQWEEDYKYTISYYANNKTSLKETKIVELGNYSLENNLFEYPGYIFKGWNTKADGTGTSYSAKQSVYISNDLILYAQWEINEYTITFNSNDGINNTSSQKAEYGKQIQLTTNSFTKEGFVFIGWNTKADGTGISYTDGQKVTITQDMTLYAQWEKYDEASVSYRTHVQDYGWQSYVRNGEMSGTSGQSKRLEAINLKLEDTKYSGNIEYKTHIQNIGWESEWKKNGEMSGTSGKSYRLEAIKIKLTGEISQYYDVYYRVHAENFGWLDWAKNGESAGTAGYAYRLEGIEIKLLEKGSPTLNTGLNCYEATINYRTHVQDYGWQPFSNNGELSGTSGQSKRLEGIEIKFSDNDIKGSIEYKTHIQNIGWESEWKKNGEMSGTSGKSYRLEAIKIRLTGELAEKYDIYYRVHAQNFGWLDWAKNGESAGTAGYAYRLEAIKIKMVKKGTAFPGKTTNHFYEKNQ